MQALSSHVQEMRQHILIMMKTALPPLMKVPVPQRIQKQDWFRDLRIDLDLEIFGLPLFRLETLNGKAIPLFKTFIIEEEIGHFENRPIVIGATSGNWGISGGLLAPMFNIARFQAVIDAKTPLGKQAHLKASGAEVILAPEGVSPIIHAEELGRWPGHRTVNQYTHEGSIHGHLWTMNHVRREMDAMNVAPSIFGAVAGTASTIMAAQRYLQPLFPAMKIVAVASMSDAEKVPGSRSPHGLAELKDIGGFPFEETIDFPIVTSVPRAEAFETSIELIRSFISAGPTGGLLISGFFHLLGAQAHKGKAALDALRNDQGKIVFVPVFMDTFLPYLDQPEYQAALPA
jgi:cysteine synthase